MFLSKKVKALALCLALLSCFSVMLPCAVMADACEVHGFSEGTVVPATQTEDGRIEYVCSVCGAVETESIPRIGDVKLTANSAAFKDKAQRPEVIVADVNGEPINPEYYTISMETDYGASVPFAKQIGRYNVIVTFSGHYAGEIKLEFKVTPVQVESLSAHAAGKHSVTLSYSKVSGARGYQIYYSDHRHGPYKRLATTSKTTITCSGLKSGKAYYFKVRAYVGTRTGNIGGEFSGVRKVTLN